MNGTKITAEFTDLDEAVMEMQPDQRRGHPGLPGDGPRHDGPHDLLGPGARVVVELREQAAPRVSRPTRRLGRAVTVAHGYCSTRHSSALVPD